MTKHIVVKRIPITQPFDYPAAKAEHDDAIARGDSFKVEAREFVIRTPVHVRDRWRAA